jgi:GntR family transcriptional regulator
MEEGSTATFEFRLDGRSGVPPYLQLVHQVKQGLQLGYLQPGDRLPTVKEVVTRLAINPNTVVKAYRQLEHEALVVPRPGQGTFIDRRLTAVAPGAHAALRRSLERWLRSAYAAGLDDEAISALVSTTQHQLHAESEGIA